MAVPAGRTPVRIARGLFADLQAALSALQEGEICWAEDRNQLFVVEGSGLSAHLQAASGGGTPAAGGGLHPGNGVSANAALEIETIDTGSF